ncbi:SNF2 superfamily chromatin remodeling protein [Amanita muscaria]
MTSRLDRLLLLLDTGSSLSVRNTAAKQLAQLAVKSVISDVTITDEDVKSTRQHVSLVDNLAWTELMAVVARILPYLHSKSFESRSAASVALSQIFSLVPVWKPSSNPHEIAVRPPSDFPKCSVRELILSGKLLLASSGKEFAKPSGILSSSAEVQKARTEAMGRLGLEFLDNIAEEMDLEKELTADTEIDPDVDMEDGGVKSEGALNDSAQAKATKNERSTPTTPIGSSPATVLQDQDVDMGALSARERNRLKRKRKPGNSAFVAPPPQTAGAKYNAAPTGQQGHKARLVMNEESISPHSRMGSPSLSSNEPASEKVIIDPSKGGAVSPKATKEAKALDVQPGFWIWDGVVKVLEVDLFSAAWEIRHGAAIALRELLKLQGRYGGMQDRASWECNEAAHEKWCNDLAAKFLCVFVLDRFGDFVSDQVVAPVRETVSQTLASLMIHMPTRSLLHVHNVLLQMIRQDFDIPANLRSKTLGTKSTSRSERAHIWEVRHAGLLGLKYEVAVRSDLFDKEIVIQGENDFAHSGKDILRDVVEAAVLGLGDRDDDVRAVAASCLIPVAGHLVDQLPETLDRVLNVLWNCLSDMKDDLSSSVGAVMDLLGKLVTYDEFINLLARESFSLPLSTLAQTLFPFFRHTIANVRLAVVNTLESFMAISSLPRDWIQSPFLRLLFQNIIVEERPDIRAASLSAWRTALSIISSTPGWLDNVVTQQLVLDWYGIMMTPIGVPITSTNFYNPSASNDTNAPPPERHNVDKNMLSQDLSLVAAEVTIKARIAAATALAYLIIHGPLQVMEDVFYSILMHYIDSTSMLQKFLAAIVSEEWAREYHLKSDSSTLLVEQSSLAKDLSNKMLAWLQGNPPAAYHEMALSLGRIHNECTSLLLSFSLDCKLPLSAIPSLGTEIDITGTKLGCFTIDTAQAAVGPIYTRLKDSLGKTRRKELAVINEKRSSIVANIERYMEIKGQHDIRISASFAAAFIAFRSAPEKVSPVVKGIMNSVKNEENVDLQMRSATAVASFVDFCILHNLAQPPDKIVKNLCTFLCQDDEHTPTFAYMRKYTEIILTYQNHASPPRNEKEDGKDKDKANSLKSDESNRAGLSRRGARQAFQELSAKFGQRLFDVVPSMWQSMAGGLLSTLQTDTSSQSDMIIEKQFGQDVIDSFSVLEAVVPTFHAGVWPKLAETFPMIKLALQSRFAIIRQSAAKCLATICEVMTTEAMRFVVEDIVPLLGDPLVLTNRLGATELIYHIVQSLDIKALPYVIFMVVPILGRMSDSNEEIRSLSTNTFASLVKMVPLEAGLPDPPGFPVELLKRREQERQFLTQLLDGSKVERYEIPVSIKAELRKYQQEGVNWLAFLAKYQLHGILCDDMGLGKTLQSICILASKHHERAERYKATKQPDAIHMPSLIICPPTLTGHWYYEILKYADNLRPILYTGNSRERVRLLGKLKSYDVVITSYEVVRNDISNIDDMNWLYCILDEGHIIKNAKTKLTKAVKCVRAQHRLILSGTPIQNNVLELWSLFDFLMPGFLGTESSFNDRFGKPILSNRDGKSKNNEAAALALEALHKQVLPFLLRRLKEDVLNDLPPKIIQDYYCELSDLQKQLYDDFSRSKAAEGAIQAVKPSAGQDQQHIFQSLQYLRKLCNHPALVLKNNTDAIDNALAKVGASSTGLNDIQHAPKLQALRQLLTDCGIGCSATMVDTGKSELIDAVPESNGVFSQHRALIFCQMKQMLDIIEIDLFKRLMPSVTYMRLDGSTEASKRHAIVQTFNSDPSIDCLLLTTHVGGLGLTLTGADTVIFVEHDWNPMKDLQAMDRAHRIGQKKVVNVYRLITKGTLEEKIMGLQRFKLNIANSVVTQQNSGLASMDTDLVLDLFRHTTEEDDTANAAKKNAKETSGPVSQKNLLQGLEALPPEEEYESLDMANFMSSLGP